MSPTRARILVVDDDPGVLHAVRRVLGDEHELACTPSPAEAQALAARFDPDLAILDVRMPEVDGFELMQRLKADRPDLDVIFVTGSLSDPDTRLIRAIRQGAFYFVQKPFDRDVLLTLVERCLELRRLRAVAERELTKLRSAQARLLPQCAPQRPDYRIAFRYRPFYFATGDYYDFFPLADGSLAVFVGDSTGHGPSASMLMASMRTLLRTRPQIHGDPGGALGALTRALDTLIAPDLFMTAVYLTLGRGGQVRWAAAGQHPPLRVTATGAVQPADLTDVGLPLGVDAAERYATVTWQVGAGERLVLFTDGIVESTDRQGKLLGTAGVRALLERLSRGSPNLEELVDGLVGGVRDHLEGSDFEDDFTLLAIERRAES
jgi:serine phosphatase RsbU (regulator of sigma subunit)